jgi:hypothetical protein
MAKKTREGRIAKRMLFEREMTLLTSEVS